MTGACMEENYKLEKEYKVPADLFRDAYFEFQKKYVYPKSYVYMTLFFVIAVGILIFGILSLHDAPNKQKYLVFLAFVAALAFAMREWFNPRKMRRNLTQSVMTLGEPIYKIGFADGNVDISTVADDLSDLPEEERDIPEEIDPLPDKTRLNVDESFQLMEYDNFFLIMSGTDMLYILPKEGFSEAELEIVRKTNR